MDHLDLIQIIFSFLLVGATIVYVIFTYKLVLESRKTRETGLKPNIIMFLDSGETSPSSQYLNIRNVGSGLAINVKFQIIKDLEVLTAYDRTIESQKFLSRNYSNFPPGYNFRNHAFDLSNDYENKINSEIIIKCSYEDIFKENYEQTFNLKLSDGFGHTKMTPPETYEGLISYEIGKLKNELKEINKTLIKNSQKETED